MQKHFNSVLTKVAPEVFATTDALEAKQIVTDLIEHSRVKAKEKMLADLTSLATLYQVQRYFCNALLKFEGLGVAQ